MEVILEAEKQNELGGVLRLRRPQLPKLRIGIRRENSATKAIRNSNVTILGSIEFSWGDSPI
jgi:hypothetical protein